MSVIAQEKDSILMVTEEFRNTWNDTLIYGDVFKREHSISLAEAIRDIPPGKALDVAMGEGHNTLFLARNGWETTGSEIIHNSEEVGVSDWDPSGRFEPVK